MREVYADVAPQRILMGWGEGLSKNDAIAYAKGYIQRRFEAVDASWYAVAPFMGGYLWEVHEGGPGKAYMPAVLTALSQDPGGQHWFPSGDRAFQVMMRDGKPLCILLSKSESNEIINSGKAPLLPSGKMARAVNKGTGMLVVGATLFGAGFSFMIGAGIFYAISANPAPQFGDIKFENMPHAQWHLVANVPATKIVSKLEFDKGAWKVETREHVIKGVNDPTKADPAPSFTQAERSSASDALETDGEVQRHPAPHAHDQTHSASPAPAPYDPAHASGSAPPVKHADDEAKGREHRTRATTGADSSPHSVARTTKPASKPAEAVSTAKPTTGKTQPQPGDRTANAPKATTAGKPAPAPKASNGETP